MSRRAAKLRRRAARKRRAAIRATRLMHRMGQIPREERDELVEFWRTADDQTVLRAMGRARRDALVATGRMTPGEAEGEEADGR